MSGPSYYSRARTTSLPWGGTVDFSQTVDTNAPLIFTAGQGPFDEHGAVIGLNDPEAQIRQTLRNLASVLEAVGGSLETIVTQTVYLARAEDFPVFRNVRLEFFESPFPATTTLRVDLLEPGMLIELQAVATAVPRARGD
jgi:2-iminobutanoate/2-iminopropanoate deaminase